MILLASTSDKIQVITGSAVTVDVHASYVDGTATITPGRKNTAITTATTTDVVASPDSGVYRTVKTLTVANKHATTSVAVTVQHTDGTTTVQLIQVTVPAGGVLHYHESAGFWVTDSGGRTLTNESANGSGAAVNDMNLVVLASDVTNNNATANTIADVTGLSFSVTAGEGYWFRFRIFYTSAATTTGSRWSINGPASPTWLGFVTSWGLSAAGTSGTDTTTIVNQAAYDSPSASNASSPTATAAQGNVAIIEGFIVPSGNGTVIARFASEVSSSAIVAKKGSMLEWYRAY
jgi:hypothetical protein